MRSPGAPLPLALLLLAIGGGIMAVGAGLFPSALDGAHAPLSVILAAGAVFALAGLAFLGQGRLPQPVAGLIPCLILTLFAVIPAWIAFGDGPRRFSASLSGFGVAAWWSEASLGRIAFGLAALLMVAITVFAWSAWWTKLPSWGRIVAPLAAVAAGWLLLVVMPAEPRWNGLADDHERLRRYAVAGEEEGWLRPARRGRPIDWLFPPWRNFEAWTKAARSRLAAQRPTPPEATVLTVPLVANPPRIDGKMGDDEWRGALELESTEPPARVRILSDGARLHLAAEVPADTTAAGFDQFRFWYHLDLSRALADERAFLDGSGGVNVLRTVRFPWGDRTRERSDWHTQRKAQGASRVDGFRRYELALDLEESGLHRGVAFPAFIDIEGDPERDADGKFRARTVVGRIGSRQAPVWLRIAP